MGGMGVFALACRPRGEMLANLMLLRLERLTRPNEAQRPRFDRVKEAFARAREIAQAGCPTEPPLTIPSRLAAAEKRLATMLDAVRTIRPVLDEYYASLTEEQKARLYFGSGRGWRGGWRDREDAGPRRWQREDGRGNERRGEGGGPRGRGGPEHRMADPGGDDDEFRL